MTQSPEIKEVIDAGSPGTNEDKIWIDTEVNAVLILDGTSGVKGDFGGEEEDRTGGQKYVDYMASEVENILDREPERALDEVMKSAIGTVWDRFESEAEENVQTYLSGDDATLQTAETVPAAVGSLIRWNDDELEIMHVGDVETYICMDEDQERFSNSVHEALDDIRDEYVEEYGKGSAEVQKITGKHRSAHNLPGTYPNMSFNPLVVEKLGTKKSYPLTEVKRVVLSTDGGTTRMKRVLDMDDDEVLQFLKTKGPEKALEELREKESSSEIAALKKSDDAGIADIRFQK